MIGSVREPIRWRVKSWLSRWPALLALLALAASAAGLLQLRWHEGAAGGPSPWERSERGFPRLVKLSDGTEVLIPWKPRYVASFTLATDEILLELLPPERIAALTYLVDDPAYSYALEGATRVPNRHRGDVETVLALQPDLVIAASYTPPETIHHLKRAGIPILHLQRFDNMADILANIRRVGRALGEEQQAAALVARMEDQVAEIRSWSQLTEPRPRVLYYNRGWSLGGGTLIDEMIDLANGRNVLRELDREGFAAVSWEEILVLDPDVILISGGRGAREAFLVHPLARDLRSVRGDSVFALSDGEISSVSHNATRSLRKIATLLAATNDKGVAQ